MILPQGLPADPAVREACLALLLRAGGDLQRLVEGGEPASERGARQLARLPGVGGPGVPPLVLLSRCNPVGIAVVQTRAALQASVPALGRAAWLLFVHDDPFFADAARRLGTLDRPLGELPIWTCGAGTFLVLEPASDPLMVSARLVALETGELRAPRPEITPAMGPSRRPSVVGKLRG
ncbi:MAG: hypothetical protein IT376_02940 [Polyangiaceae bacterium]|nr:hypothetical protein [Polyangiaceae bacterium]